MELDTENLRSDAEVESLMARVREAAQRRRGAVADRQGMPGANTGSAPAELETTFKAQADFNQAVVASLGTIAQQLQSLHSSLATLENRQPEDAKVPGPLGRQLDDLAAQVRSLEQWSSREPAEIRLAIQWEAERQAQAVQHANERMDRLFALVDDLTTNLEIATAYSSRLQQRLDEELARVQQRVQHDITAVEELLQEVVARNAQTGQQLYDQIGQVFALVDGLEQRLAGLESQTSSLEQQLNRAREDVRIVLQPTLIKLDQRTEATIGDVAEASNRLDRELAEVRAGMQQGLAVVEERRREEAQRAQALVAATSQLSRKVSHELEEMRVRVLRAERKIRVARQPQAQRLLAAEPGSEDLVPAGFQAEAAGREVAMPVIAAADPDAFDYFLFEHRYRGTREDIQQRQAAYLNLFRDRQNVVDVGCGRGEFVELLQQNGIPVTGVDINPDMVELCQDRGLPVVLAHMFDYLQGLPDASLDGIFSAQVVEHISPQQILTLFQLCAQKLKSGGVVVMETVNPNCPYALGNFYLDPTHVRPAPARLLAFIAEQSLFKVQSLKFSAPVADSQAPAILEVTSGWPEQVSLYQDYAVVASKL